MLPAAGAVVAAPAGTVLGLVAFVVPGVYFGLRWWFAPQAAVVDGVSPREAMRRSAALVSHRWWEVAGTIVLVSMIVWIVTLVPVYLLGLVLDGPVLYVAGRTLLGTAGASASALFTVLLFFSLRAEWAL